MMQTVKNRFGNMGIPAFPMAHLLVFWGGIENGFNAFSHNPEDYAKQITTPALLLYGEQDDRVTRSETDAIYRNLAGEKKLVTFAEAGHENYLKRCSGEWINSIGNFLK